jgi:hypothetical protein
MHAWNAGGMATASFGLGSGTAALACLVDTYLKDLGCAKPVKALLFFSFFFTALKPVIPGRTSDKLI